MTKFSVQLNKMQQVCIDNKTYYVFMPVSKYAQIVIDSAGKTYMHYHFEGVEACDFTKHNVGSMLCQPLCGHELKRFHASCFTCGYRKAWLGKMPMLLPIKMMYQVFIPTGEPQEVLKDAIRKRLLTIVEMTCT